MLHSLYPMAPSRRHAAGRAILTGAVVEIEDVLSDPEYQQNVAALGGWRSMLAVPMVREGVPLGTIVIQRAEAGAFPESQVALLKTFADQAVIAIENVAPVQRAAGADGGAHALGAGAHRRSARSAAPSAPRSISRRCSPPSCPAPSSSRAPTAAPSTSTTRRREEFAPARHPQSRRGGASAMARRRPHPEGRRRGGADGGDARARPDPRHRARQAPTRAGCATCSSRTGTRALLGRAAPPRGPSDRRPHRQPEDARGIPAGGGRAAPDLRHASRPWPSRTRGSSGSSRTRAASSRWPTATSRSSSPTCPTSCARRSTPSSATARCSRRRRPDLGAEQLRARPQEDQRGGQAPARADQRRPRPLEDRGGQDGALPRDLRRARRWCETSPR